MAEKSWHLLKSPKKGAGKYGLVTFSKRKPLIVRLPRVSDAKMSRFAYLLQNLLIGMRLQVFSSSLV